MKRANSKNEVPTAYSHSSVAQVVCSKVINRGKI